MALQVVSPPRFRFLLPRPVFIWLVPGPVFIWLGPFFVAHISNKREPGDFDLGVSNALSLIATARIYFLVDAPDPAVCAKLGAGMVVQRRL